MENILGKKGLTSSEANHVTNIIKELVKDIDIRSSSMPISTSILTVNGTTLPIDNNKRVEDWVDLIKSKGELFSLSAWLKSGIKTKEGMLNILESSRYSSKGIELLPYVDMPRKPSTEFGDYLDTLTTKERADYLSAESMAAHIGKFVHNFDEIRGKVDNFEKVTVREYKDTVGIIQHELLYTKDELLEGFFELQKSHREAEKVVNHYKSLAKTWEKSMLDDYAMEVTKASHKNKVIEENNSHTLRDAETKFLADVRAMKAEVSSYKIIIPNDLQRILDYVQDYAK